MTGRVLAALVVSVLAAGGVRAADKSSSRPNVISVPSGPGSIAGLGESFPADLNSGSARETIALVVPPGTAGLAPALAFSYDSGFGNGPLGIGWSLGLSTIQVQTEKGLPRYDGTDRYLLDGAELVPLADGTYRLESEGRFVRARFRGDHWEVEAPDGKTLRYGVSPESRVEGESGAVFSWALEEVVDPFGNRVSWFHERDAGQVYLAEVQYNRRAGAADNRIVFDYEPRPDVLTDCRPRFCVATAKRLRLVSMYASGGLVRRYRLDYDQANGVTLLAAVTQIGSDDRTTLPPVRFWYSPFTLRREVAVMQSAAAGVPGPGAADDELVDVDGDGFPDLLHAEAGAHWYHLNEGGLRFGARREMSSSPSVALSTSGVEIADLDGDGLADLVARTGTTTSAFRYFPATGAGGWSPSVTFTNGPSFGFEDPNVRLLDVDFDKRIDAVQLTSTGFHYWRNAGGGAWEGPYSAPLPPGEVALSFADPKLKLADMNGDRLLDLVLVRTGSVVYWPSLGWCTFGAPIAIGGAPDPGAQAEAGLLLADVTADGLADLVSVDTDHVEVWPLLPWGMFAPGISIATPHRNTSVTAVRLADMNGNGSTDLVWATPTAEPGERLVYLDTVGELRPNLLVAAENGLGKALQLHYSSSGSEYQEAREAGEPWATRVPFPVQVVSASVVQDGLGHEQVIGYRYRDGWYAPETREFRGFARVTETEVGDAQEATAVRVHTFDLGAEAKVRKGLPLCVEVQTEAGTLLRREAFAYAVRTHAVGTDGLAVRSAERTRHEVEHWEGTSSPVVTREEWTYDDFGNVLVHSEWGIVDVEDVRAGKDERITTSTYANDTTGWLLGRVTRTTVTDAAGAVLSDERTYYDGEPFVGLPHGRLGLEGVATRIDAWVEGERWAQTLRVQRDGYGNFVAELDPLGTRRDIAFDRETNRFPISETVYYGSGRMLTVSAEHDPVLGTVVLYRDAAGQETRFAWDALSRLTAIAKPGDTLARPSASFEYTLGNPLSSVRTVSRVRVGGDEVVEKRGSFDGLGRTLGIVEEASGGRTVATGIAEYGARGHVVREHEPFFSTGFELPGAAGPATSRTWDALGREVATVLADGSRAESRFRPLAVERWDAEDLDPASSHHGTPRIERLSALGLAEVEERLGANALVTRYDRDALGRLGAATDANGNMQSWRFDGLGRIREFEDLDTGLTQFVLDDAGNVLRRTDARGAVWSAEYDGLGRPTAARLVDPDGAEEERVVYHYDDPSPLYPGDPSTGLLAWVEDGAGEEHYRHDARGRVVESVRKVDGVSYRLAQELDQAGRLLALEYPDGRRIAYERDARGLLVRVPGVVEKVEHDASGRPERREYANGAMATTSYDVLHRPMTIGTRLGEQVVQALGYGYDRAGNPISIADGVHATGTLSSSRAITYDDLYRVTGVDGAGRTWSYAYSATGDFTHKSDVGAYAYEKAHRVIAAGALRYSYDDAGNMQTRPGARLTFDARERLKKVTLDDGTVVTYRYDYAGHRVVKTSEGPGGRRTVVYIGEVYEVRDGEANAYVVDGTTKLARLLPAGTSPAAAGSTSRSLRTLLPPSLGALAVTALAFFAWVSRRKAPRRFAPALAALGALAVTVAACSGGGSHPPVTAPLRAVYFHGDHLGSTAVVTDSDGKVVSTATYDAWGAELAPTSERYGYTGKEYERELGLYDYAARAYDPVLARFVSADSIAEQQYGAVPGAGAGFHEYGGLGERGQIGRFIGSGGSLGKVTTPATLNRFSYVHNNPFRHTDPSGHYIESALDLAFITYDAASWMWHSATGNHEAAMIDALALGADALCLAAPIATGGGLVVRAGDEGAKLFWTGSKQASQAELKAQQAGVRSDFDGARREAFERAGMTKPSDVSFSKYDSITGTVVEFRGPGGAKVGYDAPHPSPGPAHDTPHVSWQSAGKRGAGARKDNIPYAGPQHPSRPPPSKAKEQQ